MDFELTCMHNNNAYPFVNTIFQPSSHFQQVESHIVNAVNRK